jgi:acetyltransferase-like isoleucine patch superfamily enzyme
LYEELKYQMRYALPVWGVELLTGWWPENSKTCRVRGAMMRHFLGACGRGFQAGKAVQLNCPDRLSVGARCYLARNVWIQAMGGVTIEDEVVLGPYVVISSTNHGFKNGSTVDGGVHPAPVVIGRGSWIGAHAVITAGVTIGRGNLIAAGAVVTHDTPHDVVMGGVPAKVLGSRTDNPSPSQTRRQAMRVIA